MENKEVQKIYSHLVNEIPDKDIKELIEYLKDYVYNGSIADFE